MKINSLFTSVIAGVTSITLNYFSSTVEASLFNTITPLTRGTAVRYETTGASVTTITNTVVSEGGLIQDIYYWQFEQFLETVFAFCPDQSYTYTSLTQSQALYLEALFASFQTKLTPGIVTTTTGGVKSIKSPVGSSIEYFQNTDSTSVGSRNYEYIEPMAEVAAKVLCGASSVVSLGTLLPLLSAFGLRIEQGVKNETIIDWSTVQIQSMPEITF